MSAPLALALNLDAEIELARAHRYQRTREMTERVRALALAMKPGLPRGAFVVDPLGEAAPPDATPIAWCPTPSARAALHAAGVPLASAPDVSILARVNARPFAFALSDGELEGAVLVRDLEAALAALARPGAWLLKRSFGVSGRGQRPVRGGEATEADARFVAASLRDDGALVIEPRVTIARELSVHAWVTAAGTQIRSIREQTIDAHGAFVGSTHARALEASVRDPLVATAERVGAALADAGYAGPFGVDAYLHRGDGAGPLALRTLSEINARYCMGWDDVDGWLAP